MIKQYMCSTQLSQQPLLLLPFQKLQSLKSPKPTRAIPTKELNAKTVQEFRKTAAKIEQSPFDLMDGSNYLRGLCDRSERGEYPHALPLCLYELRHDPFQCQQEEVQEGDGFRDFAPGTPKRMQVHDARPIFPRENADGPVCVQAEAEESKDETAEAAVESAVAVEPEVDAADTATEPHHPGLGSAAGPGALAELPHGVLPDVPDPDNGIEVQQQPEDEKKDVAPVKRKPGRPPNAEKKKPGRPPNAEKKKPGKPPKAAAPKKNAKEVIKTAAKAKMLKKKDMAPPAEAAAALPAAESESMTMNVELQASEAPAKEEAKASAKAKAAPKAKPKAGPKAKSKAEPKGKSKAKPGPKPMKVKPGPKAAVAKSSSVMKNMKIYPTRPGYKGCSKCRRGGCAACKLPA